MAKETCPWCGEALEIVKKEISNKVIIHECRKCKKIVGAYQRDLEELLVNFFRRHTYTFRPEPSIKKL
jgi:DNA-directed RNA polymerase subunit M/transcription elongation factor TFIIS